jgi:acyl-CoA thioester hydrolase
MAEPRPGPFPIRVRYADTDAQGHVFFANYFVYFDEALSSYLEAIGLPYPKFSELGIDFLYIDAQCQYKGSAAPGETLEVDARVERIGHSSLTFKCTVYRQGSHQMIAGGSLTAVVVDLKTRQPVRVPDEIRQAVAKFGQGNE